MQDLTNIAFGIIIGLLFVSLLILFCALIIKLYIRKIKNYTKVIYEKDITFQKSLNSAIIETQEQVLNNISGDLHDDAGQQLTYINFIVENLKLDKPELIADLEPLSASVAMLSGSLRDISHSLNNQKLLQQNLVKAIEAEVQRLRKNNRVTINFKQGNNIKAFGTNEKIVLYRIFQEIINNIFKHSGADTIDIAVNCEPLFVLSIADNGKGFDYEETLKKDGGLGLKNIVNRAEFINFSVSVNSQPGKGTTIKLSEKTS
ncbi:sensor histidine kinase [Flavobacterium rhizosphaerae]|uniref:histidine kinase n=1 Tax=Flavobacterium rhizosphaerae TaxID=3163298 RepID=A0ABW8YT41_9FLAO